MKGKEDIPRDNFTPALEAIGNLLLHELNKIFYGGGMDGPSAHAVIECVAINQRASAFYQYLLPLRKHLVSLLAGSYRRYFKLALAHPHQAGSDPHKWAWSQLQPAVGVALEWIRDWYILACDGENRYMRHAGTVEAVPGTTASLPISTTAAPYPSPKSWLAPAWLFSISPLVGIGPLKTDHVPVRDSEQKLSAAHTRLLLKGARRVFLWELGAALETVRNEEIAAAGAIPTEQVSAERRDSKSRRPRDFEGLPQKTIDLSRYMVDLTEKQRTAFSLKYEYGRGLEEIASRMNLIRKTAYEHIELANKKVRELRSREKHQANRAKNNPDE